jgi:hypothetical protein
MVNERFVLGCLRVLFCGSGLMVRRVGLDLLLVVLLLSVLRYSCLRFGQVHRIKFVLCVIVHHEQVECKLLEYLKLCYMQGIFREVVSVVGREAFHRQEICRT